MKLVLPGPRRGTPARGWLVPLLLGGVVVVVASAAAAAAIETRTVSSFWRGLWWAVSLITTVGFIGEPPETRAGAILSAVLMVLGFILLAMVSASLAAMFVREEERPWEAREQRNDEAVVEALAGVELRLAAIERRLNLLGAEVDPPPPGAPH